MRCIHEKPTQLPYLGSSNPPLFSLSGKVSDGTMESASVCRSRHFEGRKRGYNRTRNGMQLAHAAGENEPPYDVSPLKPVVLPYACRAVSELELSVELCSLQSPSFLNCAI